MSNILPLPERDRLILLKVAKVGFSKNALSLYLKHVNREETCSQ